MNAVHKETRTPSKNAWSWGIRLVVLGLIGYWLYRQTNTKELGAALARSPSAIGLAALIVTINMAMAALRWRCLMAAFDAYRFPGLGSLFKLNLVGHFYNIFVPGAVGGDVGRGYVARSCFREATSSYFVVVSERLIGLSALGVIFALGILYGPPIPGLSNATMWTVVLVILGVGVLVIGLLGRKIRRWWSSFPQITQPRMVLYAVGLSIVAHVLTIIAFGILCYGLKMGLDISVLVVIVPVALVASVVPLAIAGIGPREVALVGLMPLMKVANADDALALSLCFAAASITVALVGGVIQLSEGGRLLASLDGADNASDDGPVTNDGG